MPTHVISVDGIAADSNTGDAPVQIIMLQSKVIIPHEDITFLPSTPYELLPAPGAGKIYIFHAACLMWKFSAGAYTNIGANNRLLITYGNYDAEASILTPFSATSSDRITVLPSITLDTAVPAAWPNFHEAAMPFQLASIINAPLKLYSGSNSGAYTGGNAANTLEVTVFYSIVNL
jgi:hypothetical protein